MKLSKIYILSACLAAAFSCTEFQEENIEMNEVEEVEMTFTATICDESDSETKTVLDGQLGDNLRKVLWTPEDEIGIFAKGYTESSHPFKFVNNATSNSETAEFKGGANLASEYFAIYPYDQSNLVWFNTEYPDGYHYSILFEIPQTQKYVEGSFDKNTAPMVAKAAYGEPLQFKNLCGILALNLTGEEKVKSISFSGKNAEGNNMYVSGDFQIIMDYEEEPVILAGPDGPTGQALLEHTYKSVSLVCDEPVQLKEDEATPFYFVLPPATYETFTLLITTADGKIMMKNGTKPLTIKRSDVQPTANLAYVETVSINLSENGIANSYIVPQAGIYSFQANVIGNGDLGIIENASFHTTDPTINPASAELLWCEHEDAISTISYDENRERVTFMASGEKGNAVIAVKDADGNILWSWHIWMTDQPAEHVYKNNTGEYIVLDRNLGATKATFTNDEAEWEAARGLVYQWGRKDPFVKNRYYEGMVNVPATYKTSYDQVAIETTIANPDTFYGVEHSFWVNSNSTSLWTSNKKTIYDPCPAGYKVAHNDVWRSFTQDGQNIYGEFERYNISSVNRKGWNFFYDGSNTTYYPNTWAINIWGDYEYSENYVTLWSSERYNLSQANCFRTYYYTESNSHVLPSDHREDQTTGHAVRCIKDDETSKTNIKITDISDITNTSANVSARVISYTGKQVDDTGFVIGANPDITKENGVVFSTDGETGNITVQLDGLSEQSVYYVKAYITEEGQTTYSSPRHFYTTSESGVYILSEQANCYIITGAGKYAFLGNIIGNGEEGILEGKDFHTDNAYIEPVKAELLWSDNIDIIQDVQYQNNLISFVASGIEGNAVIAAKDEADNILWSWHIWITDTPAEQIYHSNSGTYTLMDRNLGSLSSVIGEDAMGLFYQWGRKDPFKVTNSGFSTEFSLVQTSFNNIEESIRFPKIFAANGLEQWAESISDHMWSQSKTIYDPCPEGWRVASAEVWNGIRVLRDLDSQGYGVVFGFYDTDSFWYPDTPRVDSNGYLEGSSTCDYTELWTASFRTTKHLMYNGINQYYRSAIDGCPVRCQKID